MEKIYSAKSLKKCEAAYCGITLMEKAARGIISHILPLLNEKSLCIVCGSGNNGGDGWAVGCLLDCVPVTIIYAEEPKTIESIYYRERFKGLCINASDEKAEDIIRSSEIILDCLFGIGLCRPPLGIYQKLIDNINKSSAFVVSADIPSGISSEGEYYLPHVKADLTVCITSRKLSSVITPTKDSFGKTVTVSIGVDMSSETPIAQISDDSLLEYLPIRKDDSHKGTYGTLKTLTGTYQMTGAGILSISAALRMGVGLVKAFGEEKVLQIYKSTLSEPIFKTYSPESFTEEKATAALIGCGIGDEYNDGLGEILKKLDCPIILDADGINFISGNIDIFEHISADMIITPHPKEMERLSGYSVSKIQQNRFKICKEISEKLGITVVLKGSGTIICTPEHIPIVNETGNSGLAKGGSGDVLAGMIASLSAMGTAPHYAAALGVYLHGLAADSLKNKYSEYSFLPSDIPLETGRILAEKLHLF